jgi:hypothetical protein
MPAIRPPPPRARRSRRRAGMLLQDLHPHSALAGDDVEVVVGRDEHQAVTRNQVGSVRRRVVVGVAVQHHPRAQGAHGIDLDARRIAAHHDGGPESELARRQGDTLRVIPGRRGDDAAGTLGLGQLRDLVIGAANLEREDRLQVLALEQHRAAAAPRQARRRLQWRLDRDIVDARGQDFLDVALQHDGDCAGRRQNSTLKRQHDATVGPVSRPEPVLHVRVETRGVEIRQVRVDHAEIAVDRRPGSPSSHCRSH